MIIKFSVSNYLSIRDEQEISFVASKLKDDAAAIPVEMGSEISALLPYAIIYGPNASGKSNLLKAVNYVRQAVLFSHSRGDPDGGVPRTPFALDRNYEEKPTIVDIDFVVKGVRYNFGFETDGISFVHEWLYSFPENRRRRMYERNGDEVLFGSSLRGAKQLLVSLMRHNSLFISTATQNDHEALSDIVNFFRNIYYTSSISVEQALVERAFRNDTIDRRTIEFLGRIGTGVINHRQREVEVPENVQALVNEFMSAAKKHLGDDPGFEQRVRKPSSKEVEIELGHKSQEGETVYFGLQRESSGTRRLLLILNEVFRALDRGSLVIVDELDASLHTHAVDCIIELFSSRSLNPNNAQLIATTHDTNLLKSRSLRRDEIWFSEKDFAGASHYYSLAEVKSRLTDNFETGYLQGRYGAVPFSGTLDGLTDI